MTKKSTETAVAEAEHQTTAVATGTPSNVPAFLAEKEQDSSMKTAAENAAIARIKCVQGIGTDQKIKELFSEGQVILSPTYKLVADQGETFTGVPLYHWKQWEEWLDVNDPEANGPVTISLYADSEVAARAMSKENREEQYGKGNKLTRSFVESLCFAVYIEKLNQVAILAFAKGEHRSGKTLNAVLQARGCPVIWGNRIDFGVGQHGNGKHTWWGLDVFDPEDEKNFIDEVFAAKAQELSENFQRMHEQGLLGERQMIPQNPESEADAAGEG